MSRNRENVVIHRNVDTWITNKRTTSEKLKHPNGAPVSILVHSTSFLYFFFYWHIFSVISVIINKRSQNTHCSFLIPYCDNVSRTKLWPQTQRQRGLIVSRNQECSFRTSINKTKHWTLPELQIFSVNVSHDAYVLTNNWLTKLQDNF